ncbi:MAG TPA: zf-TFIIB domain-containing protein [candidate division Zixibacteria bacterium]|nr:zf-TFIIB domain-containing protein [candidate division Zixibacteria bacterium]
MADKWDERKKAKEDEYFIKKERELLEKLKQKQAQTKAEADPPGRMRCPKCGERLKERSFQKILIDQCSGCGGIWLDAGELEQVAGREEESWLGKFWKRSR